MPKASEWCVLAAETLLYHHLWSTLMVPGSQCVLYVHQEKSKTLFINNGFTILLKCFILPTGALVSNSMFWVLSRYFTCSSIENNYWLVILTRQTSVVFTSLAIFVIVPSWSLLFKPAISYDSFEPLRIINNKY